MKNFIGLSLLVFSMQASAQGNSCATAYAVCAGHDYPNTTGVPNGGQLGCMLATPNPSFFFVKIATAGTVRLVATQSSAGSPVPDLDIDYGFWGPYDSLDAACSAISAGAVPYTSCENNDGMDFYNATAGKYYVIETTNFSNQAGTVRFEVNPTSVGTIECPTSLSVSEGESESIRIFPNPASDIVEIGPNRIDETISQIRLFNLVGKEIRQFDRVAAGQTSIDVSGLADGVYLVEITTESRMKLTRKLIIK